MPGCPPESHQIAAVIDLVIKVLQGEAELPPKGAVIGAGDSTVCDECPRKRNVKMITAVQAHSGRARTIDPNLCLLEQGIPCNGPATRSGCGALLSASRRAVHRLLRPGRGCGGLRRAADHRLCLGDRLRMSRKRSTGFWTASPTRPGSSIASTWPDSLLRATPKPAW